MNKIIQAGDLLKTYSAQKIQKLTQNVDFNRL